MKKSILCRLGLHSWGFSHGKYHRYYECMRSNCSCRKVLRRGGGYQPIDQDWLNGKA